MVLKYQLFFCQSYVDIILLVYVSLGNGIWDLFSQNEQLVDGTKKMCLIEHVIHNRKKKGIVATLIYKLLLLSLFAEQDKIGK